MPPSATLAPTRPVTGTVPIEVWEPGPTSTDLDKLIHRTGGVQSKDPVALTASANGRRVLDWLQAEFGRSSFDGRGSTLKLRVHAPDPITGEPKANNAFWFNDEQRIWLGDGDGTSFGPLGGGADVISHELFHGVIDSEVKLEYVGQEGALHESFADVLSTGVDGNWTIGEDVYTPDVPGDALRDLSNLQYRDWRTFPPGYDEVHAMGEVPSHAAFLVGSKLGAQEMRRIWYAALVDHLADSAGFAGARDATIAAAAALHGERSAQAQAVQDAWDAVGITSSTPKDASVAIAGRSSHPSGMSQGIVGAMRLGQQPAAA